MRASDALKCLLLAIPLGCPRALLSQSESTCAAAAGAPRLDHVVLAVHDLDSATSRLAPLGFRFKPGRLHPNNLLNRHVKFRDGTSLELMTLAGPATDRMAQDYAELLSQGDGGAYLALWVDDLEPVRAAAAHLGLATRSTTAGAWRFLSVPGNPDLAAVFFGAGGYPANDPDSVVAHPNGAVGLAGAWVEAGPGFERLLGRLGARRCGTRTMPNGKPATRWVVAGGTVAVVAGIRTGPPG